MRRNSGIEDVDRFSLPARSFADSPHLTKIEKAGPPRARWPIERGKDNCFELSLMATVTSDIRLHRASPGP
jgi:hypothetical protein